MHTPPTDAAPPRPIEAHFRAIRWWALLRSKRTDGDEAKQALRFAKGRLDGTRWDQFRSCAPGEEAVLVPAIAFGRLRATPPLNIESGLLGRPEPLEKL
ncbi:MAG: hypothetical protein WBF81_06245 [Thermoplasmata archaeon]